MRKIIMTLVMVAASVVAFSQSNTKVVSNTDIMQKSAPNYNCEGCGDNNITTTKDFNPVKKVTQEENILPSDFPKYIDTGNPKQDLATFHDAKQKWIEENPQRFEEIKKYDLNKSITTIK